MKSHAPKGYVCPICLAIDGTENDQTLIKQQDILYRDDDVIVFISSFFIDGAEGQPLVSPVKHYENFYDIPDALGAKIFQIAKAYTIKMKKAYDCEGVNVLQNNEPAAGQHAFHYHLHLFPRYEGKDIWLNMGNKRLATEEERLEFVKKFR